MKRVNIGELKDLQKKTGKQVSTEDAIDFSTVKYIAGFDVAFVGEKAVCGVAVLEYPSLKVVEKKHLVVNSPMKYVPGFLAFREGPIIAQLYYDLEYDPDLIIIDGLGLLHPEKAGLASFVGVELAKPTIGVAKTVLGIEEKGNELYVDGELRGLKVKTKEHARDLIVSPGHMISIKTAAKIVGRLVVPPHKHPEPLHIARRVAKKATVNL